jgi:hypothetical protein
MARQLRELILGAICCFATLTATAQEPQPPARQPQDSAGAKHPGQRPLHPEFGNVRRALEALTPEQRQRFIENLKRWSNLPPEEKRVLADREGLRRKKIADEIDAAIKSTGLTLEGERRALFARRYAEERRKVEEQLHRELEEKRRPLVNEFVARLKAEFSAGNTAPK